MLDIHMFVFLGSLRLKITLFEDRLRLEDRAEPLKITSFEDRAEPLKIGARRLEELRVSVTNDLRVQR
jgi:hypothetical protein